MSEVLPIKHITYWQRVGTLNVFTCPSVDPKIVVVDRDFEAAVKRAEDLFDLSIEVPAPEPEAA